MSLGLTKNMLSIGLGIAGWAAFIPIARTLRNRGLLRGDGGTAGLYAATPLVTLPIVYLLSGLLNVRGSELVSAVSLATATALCFDGVAFVFSDVYGQARDRHMAAGWILFGAGVGMFQAFMINK
jgi:hypothetical protein